MSETRVRWGSIVLRIEGDKDQAEMMNKKAYEIVWDYICIEWIWIANLLLKIDIRLEKNGKMKYQTSNFEEWNHKSFIPFRINNDAYF